jgi:SAM-dependent methyltransferase
MNLLHGYHLHEYSFVDFPPGSRVLDIGCGVGQQMSELMRRGYEVVGIDPDPELVARGRDCGLDMHQAFAEHLPLPDASVDGVVCKVVLPYTKSSVAMREIARVLKPGGIGRLCYHGAGYYLLYIFCQRSWKMRLYGLRSVLNTWFYRLTGCRLPGFWGDTIYQSPLQMAWYYRRYGLRLIENGPARKFLGFPVFIYHSLVRCESAATASTEQRRATAYEKTPGPLTHGIS